MQGPRLEQGVGIIEDVRFQVPNRRSLMVFDAGIKRGICGPAGIGSVRVQYPPNPIRILKAPILGISMLCKQTPLTILDSSRGTCTRQWSSSKPSMSSTSRNRSPKTRKP